MPVSEELLEILACPMCKGDVEFRERAEFLECGKCGVRYFREACELESCRKCGGELRSAEGEVLVCRACGRWYPVVEDIPHMLPDNLREDLC